MGRGVFGRAILPIPHPVLHRRRSLYLPSRGLGEDGPALERLLRSFSTLTISMILINKAGGDNRASEGFLQIFMENRSSFPRAVREGLRLCLAERLQAERLIVAWVGDAHGEFPGE